MVAIARGLVGMRVPPSVVVVANQEIEPAQIPPRKMAEITVIVWALAMKQESATKGHVK